MRFWLICLLIISFNKIYGQTDFDKIIENIQKEEHTKIKDVLKLDDSVAVIIGNQENNGSWDNIDYSITHRTLWEPLQHLRYLNQLSLGYTYPKSKFYLNEAVFHALRNGLKYWNERDPKSNNWWFNKIAAPQQLGAILILLEHGNNELNPELEKRLIKQMHRGDPEKWTGANKLDIALHYIYRGCLLRDHNVLKKGVDESFYPIKFTTEEGLQHDYSYQQHGPQLYIGGYGTVFVQNEVLVATYLKGTSYALTGEKLKLLSKFILNTYVETLHGGYMDYSVNGRGISRENRLHDKDIVKTLEKLKFIDPSRGKTYDRAIAKINKVDYKSKLPKNQNYHFWRSDFTIHKNNNYSFSVRTSSNRTSKTENGNKENLKGYFLSDGATNIRVSGDEYYNIFPVWDWNKIPGVTAPMVNEIPVRKAWQIPGNSSFTGGVSNNVYGIHTYWLKDYGVHAKKAWFFFDDEIVCLGSNIRSYTTNPILTTIDQTTLGDNFKVFKKEKSEHIEWIINNETTYLFPRKNELQYTAGVQKGSWYEINNTQSSHQVSKKVMTAWFDHGIKPDNASYEYIVVPGISNEAQLKDYNQKDIEVLYNEASIQAAKSNQLSLLQMIFYEAGTFQHEGIKIRVDAPCALMLNYKDPGNPEVYISDPSQTRNKIQLDIKIKKANYNLIRTCNMPGGPYAGSSLKVDVEGNIPVKK